MIHPCDKPCGNKTASGYCATTACINPQYSNIGTAQYGQGVQKRIITNADRIRAMSDEELAAFMSPFAGCKRCPVGCNRYENNCVDIWLDWLRQDVEK